MTDFVPRTDDEILARVRSLQPGDLLGFQTIDLICRLPFATAKQFLRDGVTEDQWTVLPRDRDALLAEMREYLPFAWEKANNCRGLSAGRSMAHYAAWIWLLGDDLGDLETYEHYGKDHLVAIGERYGWGSAWDDGRRTNSEDES